MHKLITFFTIFSCSSIIFSMDVSKLKFSDYLEEKLTTIADSLGKSINAQDSDGITILSHVLERDWIKLAEKLIKLNADVNIPDKSNRNLTPFLLACKHETKSFLLVSMMVENKTPTWISQTLKTRDNRGLNPLMLAIERKNCDTVKFIIDKIPAHELLYILNEIDNFEMTAIHHALVSNRCPEIAYLLAAKGVELTSLIREPRTDISTENINVIEGISQLFRAAKNSDLKGIKSNHNCVHISALYKLTDQEGNSLLHIATKNRDKKMIASLLGYNTLLAVITDRKGRTSIEYALEAESGSLSLITLFMHLAYKELPLTQ